METIIIIIVTGAFRAVPRPADVSAEGAFAAWLAAAEGALAAALAAADAALVAAREGGRLAIEHEEAILRGRAAVIGAPDGTVRVVVRDGEGVGRCAVDGADLALEALSGLRAEAAMKAGWVVRRCWAPADSCTPLLREEGPLGWPAHGGGRKVPSRTMVPLLTPGADAARRYAHVAPRYREVAAEARGGFGRDDWRATMAAVTHA